MRDDVTDMNGLMSTENFPATFPCSYLFHIGVIHRYPSKLQLALTVDERMTSISSGSRKH